MAGLDVYHSGEIAVQERAGERSVAQRRGAIIGSRLSDGARAFVDRQGAVAIAAAGPDGGLWASLWCGIPGFLRADEHGDRVDVMAALDRTLEADPVRAIIHPGIPVGLVVIDFESRLRLRINGTVGRMDGSGLEVRIRETFGNCIKYIQRRGRSDDPAFGGIARVESGHTLDAARRELIAQTDTLFVASMHPERGLDVSHRGGHPGFVRMEDERTLRIPDYPGNSMFQTFGNFEVDTRAGLALIDFERRRVLSLTGDARVVFGADDPLHPTGGTGRYWSFTVVRWVEYPLPPTIKWTLLERSPFNPRA